MIVGYLVPHRCPNKALAKCVKCGRQFCDEHVEMVESGLLCLACKQGFDQPVMIQQEGQAYNADDLALFAALGAQDASEDFFSDLS
jgi:recombinational DNA repair protein (RecF pathway)